MFSVVPNGTRSFRGRHSTLKRWLFIAHPDVAWRSAVIYTFMLSCRRRGINPQEYLRDALRLLPAMNITRIAQLLPGRWKAQPPKPGELRQRGQLVSSHAPDPHAARQEIALGPPASIGLEA